MVMSPPTCPVTHVIFDFDGLLVDTEPCFTKANQMMLKRFDKEFTMDMKRNQMGMKHLDAIEWLINEVGISDRISVADFARDYDAFLNDIFPKAPELPGARRLVEHLVSHNVPVAICSGSCSRTFELKEVNHKQWTDLIPIKVLTGDDVNVKRGKPYPDGFLYTMTRFPSPPPSASSVLVFEDAPNGVRAALSAGMQCVMVPDPAVFTPDQQFRSTVNRVLSSLEDFRPEDFGLPPFDN